MRYFYPDQITRKFIILLIFLFISVIFTSKNTESVLGAERISNVLAETSAFYLPIISIPDPFVYRAQSIWSHTEPLSNHEVSLFRREFNLADPASDTVLFIFADTRYELWLDGEWIGRGPARFSLKYHEYDVHSLGDLDSGKHTVAVLVQWAPNNRRSESTTPYLQAYIEGLINGNAKVLAQTDHDWKVVVSDAWITNSAPVHSWQTIGPTELMDLSQYESEWMLKGYDDASWTYAVIKDPNKTESLTYVLDHLLSEDDRLLSLFHVSGTQDFLGPALYRPRTILKLFEKEFPYSVLDSGLLSPGREMIDFIPPPENDGTLFIDFSVEQNTDLTIERLSEEVENSMTLLKLNGQEFQWADSSVMRPDVQESKVNISPGNHQLIVEEYPEDGVRLNLSIENINWGNIPFEQGINAGKRLLLAEYISQESMVEMAKSETILINQLPAYLILDVGRIIHGRLLLDILGSDGTIVDIGWDERLFMDTSRPLPYPGSAHPQWNQTDSWILDGNKNTIRTIDTRAGRYILLAFWGNSPVTLENIRVFEERYPLIQSGDFVSSDELLDEIWKLGVETAYPNMTDAYADPWRERGQWWGDSYIVDRVNRVAFGDITLLKRGLRFMADGFVDGKPVAMSPNGNIIGAHMLDYAMLWVHDLQEFSMITEDWDFLLAMYPTLKNLINYLETSANPTTGLLDLPKDHWSQTVYIDTRAYNDRYGQSTTVNSIYYETLVKAVSIANVLGDNETGSDWESRAKLIKDRLNQHLYDPITKRYYAGLYNGEFIPPTPQAQAWALTYNVVPEKERVGVSDALLELLSDDPGIPNVGIYGMNWVFEGLERSGRLLDAIDIIRLYYGYLVDKNATTLWERFDADQYYWASLSHGWGGSPTWILTTYVLGAKWIGPGEWQVKPSFSAVDFVSGAIPLPDGLLVVDWDNQTCQNKILNVQSPELTIGKVIIPEFQNAKIFWEGQTVWSEGKPYHDAVELIDSDVVVTVSGGNHHFEIISDCLEP